MNRLSGFQIEQVDVHVKPVVIGEIVGSGTEQFNFAESPMKLLVS